MSTESLRDRLPSPRRVGSRIASALLVGLTLVVLGERLAFAVIVAGGAFVLWILTDLADALVGDYAGNALFGALVVVVALRVLRSWPLRVAGLLIGGWLVLDGVQHLRHGVSREESLGWLPPPENGGPVRGLVRVLLARLVEPVVLGRDETAGPF